MSTGDHCLYRSRDAWFICDTQITPRDMRSLFWVGDDRIGHNVIALTYNEVKAHIIKGDRPQLPEQLALL
jgi:hypothetical protein